MISISLFVSIALLFFPPEKPGNPSKSLSSLCDASSLEVVVADFDTDEDPVPTGGTYGKWNEVAKVEVSQKRLTAEEGGGGILKIQIQDNAGIGPKNFTGGGAWISIQYESNPTDISECTHLEFKAAITDTSKLANARIKLEDSSEKATPQLVMASAVKVKRKDAAQELSTDWQTYRVPLTKFTNNRWSEGLGWHPVDLEEVTKITFVILHENDTSDGTLLIDDIQFLRLES